MTNTARQQIEQVSSAIASGYPFPARLGAESAGHVRCTVTVEHIRNDLARFDRRLSMGNFDADDAEKLSRILAEVEG